MHKALLLPAWKGVEASVEIRNDGPLVARKQRFKKTRLATFCESKYHVPAIGQDPNILVLA
jgi:hypothetical protein